MNANPRKNDNGLLLARLNFWQAIIVSLIAAVSGIVIGYFGNQSASIDNGPAQMMPLEGEWDYKMKYSKYQKIEGQNWQGFGGALIAWDARTSQYIMYCGSEIRNVTDEANEQPVTALCFRAIVPATKEGIPKTAEVQFNYVARLSETGFKPASDSSTFSFSKIPTAEVDSFEINYTSNTTEGDGKFTRLR